MGKLLGTEAKRKRGRNKIGEGVGVRSKGVLGFGVCGVWKCDANLAWKSWSRGDVGENGHR